MHPILVVEIARARKRFLVPSADKHIYTLRLKRICSTTGEYEKHTENLKKQLIKKGYPETIVNEEIQKATNQDRAGLLNKEKTETGNHLTLWITYSKTLLDIKTIVGKR